MEQYTDLARQICQLREWTGPPPPGMIESHAAALADLPPLGQTVRAPHELAVVSPQPFGSASELALQLHQLAQP